MNTRVRLAVLSAAVTVTVLSVTGCAPATPTNTATVTVTESVSTPVPSETASGTPAESPEAPAEDDRTGEAMAGGFQGIALDMPFSEAMKAAEVASIDVCPWAAFGEREGYQLIVARDSEGADDSPLLEVAALAPPDTTDLVGRARRRVSALARRSTRQRQPIPRPKNSPATDASTFWSKPQPSARSF